MSLLSHLLSGRFTVCCVSWGFPDSPEEEEVLGSGHGVDCNISKPCTHALLPCHRLGLKHLLHGSASNVSGLRRGLGGPGRPRGLPEITAELCQGEGFAPSFPLCELAQAHSEPTLPCAQQTPASCSVPGTVLGQTDKVATLWSQQGLSNHPAAVMLGRASAGPARDSRGFAGFPEKDKAVPRPTGRTGWERVGLDTGQRHGSPLG